MRVEQAGKMSQVALSESCSGNVFLFVGCWGFFVLHASPLLYLLNVRGKSKFKGRAGGEKPE